MMKKHFILTEEFKVLEDGTKVFRIKATKAFQNIKKGDLGGFVESEDNLFGTSWVYDDCIVSGNSVVNEKSKVKNNSVLENNSVVKNSVVKNKLVLKKSSVDDLVLKKLVVNKLNVERSEVYNSIMYNEKIVNKVIKNLKQWKNTLF